jgi:hypothetical protein
VRFSKKAINKDIILKDELLKAKDISNNEFNLLIAKQKNSLATHEDKVLIERYLYKLNWKINDMTPEFLDSYYGKTESLLNLRFLLDKNKIDPYLLNEFNEYSVDYDKANKLEQIKMIKEIISKLGFNNIGDGKLLDKETFEKNIKKVIQECELFANPNKSQPMFGFNKSKINGISTVKKFMGFMNSVFREWGLVVNLKWTSTKKKINDERKTVKKSNYVLSYINNINNFI